jgi:16S rRNA (adenine1518-N6/adenine1519-N6)-dimethyltransferase
MNPSEIKAVLAEIGGGANKTLGQHFLIDKTTLETIVDEAEIESGDRVLEIGPGLGVLTGALIEAGADVISIERDRRFIDYLSRVIPAKAGIQPRRFELVQGDAAKLDWDSIVGEGDWKFVANLPYAITSLAIRKALYAKNPPTNLVVLIQREVAERIIARDQKQSLLSLMVAFASHETRLVRRVAPGAFFPPPKVESAVLRVNPMSIEEREAIWGIDPEYIMAYAKKGFAHPRKLLASNLGIKGEFLEKIGFPAKIRAEDLSPDQWRILASALKQAEK